MTESLRGKFGARVRQLRKARRRTQEKLAEKAGMEYKHLGAIERGEKNVTINNIEKIARGLEVKGPRSARPLARGLNPGRVLPLGPPGMPGARRTVEPYQFFLFSTEGLKPTPDVTRDKITPTKKWRSGGKILHPFVKK